MASFKTPHPYQTVHVNCEGLLDLRVEEKADKLRFAGGKHIAIHLGQWNFGD